MHGRSWLVAALVALLTTAAGSAQSYTLKIKSNPEPGKSMTVDVTNKVKIAVSVATDGKVLKEDTKSANETKQGIEKMLAAGANGPEKFTRTYTKASLQEDGQTKTPSYVGKTVLFERKDGKLVASAEGVTAKDLHELTKAANENIDEAKLVPAKAVMVGETWSVPQKLFTPLLNVMQGGADLKQAKVTGRLVKVYQKDGRPWGTLDFQLAVPVSKFGPLTLQKPLPFQVSFTVDTAIDGSTTAARLNAQLRIVGTSTFEQGGMTFTLNVRIEGEDHQTRSAEK